MSTNGSRPQQIRLSVNGRNRQTLTGGPRSGLMYPSRWEQWSQLIAGRHMPASARRRPLNMLLARQLSSQAFLRRVFHVGPFMLMSRINLRPLTHERAVYQTIRTQASAWPGLVDGRGEIRRPAGPGTAVSPVGRMMEYFGRPISAVINTEQLVNRVIRRREPVQPMVPSGGARPAGRAAASAAERARSRRGADAILDRKTPLRPLPMILRRGSTPIADPSAASQLSRGSSYNQPTSPADAAAWPYPPAAPVVDVNSLTDQVIQTIDRRLTSRRERMGGT